MELGGEKLNFLDLTVMKRDGRLYSNWFRKPTFSGRFLNFYSQHPFAHKKGTILSLIDRMILLSHPEFHKENFDYVIRIFLDNGYSLDLIFSTIRRRLHSMINHKQPQRTWKKFFLLHYSLCLYHCKKFIKYFKNISFCKLAFSCYDQLNKFIKVHKDTLPSLSRANVVYKINCLNCDASYVGQTKRTLNTRVAEHRNIRRDTAVSVITDHRLQSNHEFDWDDVMMLDEEINYKKRLISEMIHIKKQKHCLNSQNDTELLDPIYNDILLCNRE